MQPSEQQTIKETIQETISYTRMASSKIIFFIVAVFAFFAIPSCLATEYTVGDDKGWSLDFDQGWAAGKEFHVGDTLVFKYKEGVHNVIGVSGDEFQQCQAANDKTVRVSGNDVISLSTPGRKWYICGKAGHCANRNMKLNITVVAAQVDGSPATSPTSTSAAATPNDGFSFCGIWIALLVAFVGLVFV